VVPSFRLYNAEVRLVFSVVMHYSDCISVWNRNYFHIPTVQKYNLLSRRLMLRNT